LTKEPDHEKIPTGRFFIWREQLCVKASEPAR
jgi:hypothetical protein